MLHLTSSFIRIMGFAFLLVACTVAKTPMPGNEKKNTPQNCLNLTDSDNSGQKIRSRYDDHVARNKADTCVRIKTGCNTVKEEAFKSSNLDMVHVRYKDESLHLESHSFSELGNVTVIMKCEAGCGSKICTGFPAGSDCSGFRPSGDFEPKFTCDAGCCIKP